MIYRTHELSFQLPAAQLQDASINILKFADLGTSLIVSRSLLNEGETLRGSFDNQLKRMEQQVQEFRCQPAVDVQVGAPQAVPAIEVSNQFHKGQEQVFQFQLVLMVPNSRQMLALSYVKAQPLGADEAAHWQNIKQTLTFG